MFKMLSEFLEKQNKGVKIKGKLYLPHFEQRRAISSHAVLELTKYLDALCQKEVPFKNYLKNIEVEELTTSADSKELIEEDEIFLIEILKLMLDSEYDPPLDNLVALQWHLRAINSVFSSIIFNKPSVKVDVLLSLDLSLCKLMEATAIANSAIMKRGPDINRIDKSITTKRRNKNKNYDLVRRQYIKLFNEKISFFEKWNERQIVDEIQKRIGKKPDKFGREKFIISESCIRMNLKKYREQK